MLQRLLGSHRIGVTLNVEVRILYLLYIYIALTALLAMGHGVVPVAQALIGGAILIVSVFFHEMGHTISALKEGTPVRAILLHPFGGIAQLGGTLPGPAAEIQTALAGPCVSLLVAAVFYLAGYLLGTLPEWEPVMLLGMLVGMVVEINVMLALFNLLPVFPMDGGRVLAAILVMRHGVDEGLRRAWFWGKVGLFGLAAVGVWLIVAGHGGSGWSCLIVAMLLYCMGGQEAQARQYVTTYAHRKPSAVRKQPDWFADVNEDTQQMPSPPQQKPGFIARWLAARRQKAEQLAAEEKARRNARVDEILRKVNREGIRALTPEERQFLEESSRRHTG